MENTFYDRFFALCRAHGTSPNAVARAVGASSGSVTAWKRGATPRMTTLTALAEYLGVPTDVLLGAAPQEKSPQPVTDADIKFALFGGDGEITDAMYAEVRSFAAFVKAREEQKQKEQP